MRPGRFLGVALVFVLALSACDEETGPLLSFDSSGCKGQSADACLSLQCISYGLTEAGLAVDLFNFPSACGTDWEGVAEVDGSSVTVGVANPGCDGSACGSCLYDWAFEVGGVSGGADIDLTISVELCPGEWEPDTETVSLPAETLEQGLRCRYLSENALDEGGGPVGTIHTLCDPGAELACEGELVCAPVGKDGIDICVAPCEAVADCPLPDIMLCQENRCVLDPAVGW